MSEAQVRGAWVAAVVFVMLGALPIIGSAQNSADGEVAGKKEAEEYFRERVSPFIKTYCLECHSNKRPTEAGVNFSPTLNSPGHAAFSELWRKATARVKAHDMPPDYAKQQPAAADRQMFVDWLEKTKFLSPKDPGLFVIRRLTKTEYANTLHDLLGVDPAIASELPDEVSGAGYLNSLSPLQLEKYLSIANKALDQIISPDDARPTAFQRRMFGEPPQLPADERTAAREVARSLARKAYRRPPSQEEIDVLMTVFDLGRENKLAYPASLRLMLKAMLVSPQFLFITPAEANPRERIARLDDYQLASRLSYLLWATMPDDQLMTLADSGKLSEPAILKAQVKRLLLDPRSRALFDGFGAQWLGLETFAGKKFEAAQFPQMTSELRSAMYDEARLFFESIVRDNRSAMTFVHSDYTFLNETLAKIYGLEGKVLGPEMRRVQLSDGNRGGILGMPGVLAATSFPNRTSPVKRGVWVLEQVLGDHVPPAPPDVPALEKQDQGKVANLTLRERTELHRSNPVCANCHQLLDPIGFGLENFDAVGRWRDREENGSVIDASGELPGTPGKELGTPGKELGTPGKEPGTPGKEPGTPGNDPAGKRFSSPKELKAIIAERKDDFARNLVERLLAYALCRKLEGYDEIVVDGLMQDIAADEYRMQTLISAVVTSYPFTHRRIPDAGQEKRTSND